MEVGGGHVARRGQSGCWRRCCALEEEEEEECRPHVFWRLIEPTRLEVADADSEALAMRRPFHTAAMPLGSRPALAESINFSTHMTARIII